MKNIDMFNRYCALLLSDLYESFPVAKDIELAKYYQETDEQEAFFSQIPIATSTAKFLQDEGFIKCQSIDEYGKIKQAILTTKGLSVLTKTPDIIDTNKQTIGEKMILIGKTASLESMKATIASLIRSVIT